MSIKVEIPYFTDELLPNLFKWQNRLVPDLEIQVDGFDDFDDSICLITASSDNPMVFYMLGIYVAIHIKATKDFMKREAEKTAQEN